MSSVLRSLRSPAIIISILALVAGITGAAVAGPIASTSKLSKKDKKKVRNIADSEITKLAPTLAVASANSANSANSVGGGGVSQKSFKQAIAVSIDIPNTAQFACGSLSPAGLNGVPSGSTVIMTPPSGKPIAFTTLAGVLNGGGVYFDYCHIQGATAVNPPPATYLFNVIAP